ncbi:acetyl-CoA carboxylase biotin carboxyl carrier protein [Pararhizobium sp.]|uniref:acetyl-CoA carboxylase biotin carboxyl carrier protein n=1 Tax=Pararhizobium sp. TaxID=1977563 RepID=UPI00271FB8BD|nr:biotin/lipoyl-containing protein [Pararhizobium sp.]MDO9416393.1 biotin/lipoyl-containing protein [Pararhizobium sp.]
MDLDLIARLMQLLEASKLDELDVTENGMRIRLAKTAAVRTSSRQTAASPEDHSSRDEAALPSPDDGKHVVYAGLSGTFYRRPMPDEPRFVEAGDSVEDGRKLGIIEAMKMMNPVEADCAGRILEIHIEDGGPVSAGMPLFTLERRP